MANFSMRCIILERREYLSKIGPYELSANRLHLLRESVTQYDPPFPLGKGRPPSQIKKLHRYNEKEIWR